MMNTQHDNRAWTPNEWWDFVIKGFDHWREREEREREGRATEGAESGRVTDDRD